MYFPRFRSVALAALCTQGAFLVPFENASKPTAIRIVEVQQPAITSSARALPQNTLYLYSANLVINDRIQGVAGKAELLQQMSVDMRQGAFYRKTITSVKRVECMPRGPPLV